MSDVVRVIVVLAQDKAMMPGNNHFRSFYNSFSIYFVEVGIYSWVKSMISMLRLFSNLLTAP
jgi:hypothetical protein